MEYKYQSIVLGKRDVNEVDRLYTVYTKEMGKVRLLAKGVRKSDARLAGNLETLNLAEIFVARSRGRGNITGVIALENYLSLKNNLETLEKVFKTFSTFDLLVSQEEKDVEIFKLLADYLSVMEEIEKEGGHLARVEVLSVGFLFQILGRLGYGMQMKKCVSCGRRLSGGENFFAVSRGGTICASCAGREKRKIRMSNAAINLVRIFLENRLENFKKIRIDQKNLNNAKVVLEEAIRWIAN